jgi:hypothetical protein
VELIVPFDSTQKHPRRPPWCQMCHNHIMVRQQRSFSTTQSTWNCSQVWNCMVLEGSGLLNDTPNGHVFLNWLEFTSLQELMRHCQSVGMTSLCGCERLTRASLAYVSFIWGRRWAYLLKMTLNLPVLLQKLAVIHTVNAILLFCAVV